MANTVKAAGDMVGVVPGKVGPSLSKLNKLIGSHSWRKTDYLEAHEYVVYSNETWRLWASLLDALVVDGYWKEFRGRRYRYVNVGDYRYWLMGPIMNRALEPDGNAS